MVRLVQMLGLQRLDSPGAEPLRQLLPPPKDFIELEERRRTFWVAFHGDRWSSSGTGWAMIIQEKDVRIYLLLRAKLGLMISGYHASSVFRRIL
jgi:hypothetical protein